MTLTSMVVFILIGSTVFSLVFQGMDGGRWIESMMAGLPGGQIGFLIFVNIFVFVIAFFLDFFEIAFIIIPLLAPVADALGIDLIWFGVMLAVNMQTSFMHPPFGFSLFFLRSVAPTRAYKDRITGQTIQPVTSSQIYLGAIPYLFIQLTMVVIIIAFPGIVMHYKSGAKVADPSSVHINVPMPSAGTDADPFANPFSAPGNSAPSFGKPATP